MNIRRMEEQFFKSIMALATYTIIITLFFLVLVIIWRGLPALSWDMVSKLPEGGFYFGKSGGVLNAIVGSFYLASGATILAFLIGLPVALFMNVYLTRQRKFLNNIRFFMDVLWGVPSIVYGAFCFTLMIYFGIRTSLLAGIIAVALLVVPIMIRAIDEVLKMIPSGLLEASYALGLTRAEISFNIFLRQAAPGIITAILLAFGRGIGDAASVLFTAGYTDYIPDALTQPTATLPLAIFFQLSSPIPEVQERAYASAVILTLIILLISIATRIFSYKFKERIIS